MICYNCGKTGHISRYYRAPRKANFGQARLNAIIPEVVGYKETGYDGIDYEEPPEQQVIEGTITLYSSRVKALFDTGTTHSFIAVKII